MASNKHVVLEKIENSGTAIFKEHLFFWTKYRTFLKWKIESFRLNKTTFSFWLKINFRKMASNKHIDLKKENFVRSKCYPEGISKDKKEINLRKSF